MKRIDYLEIYVSNLPAAVRFYKNTFQFHPIAYSEQNDHSSVLIHHGSIRFVLTASKTSSSDVAHFILLHGEGVKDIAFITENVESQFELAIQKGHQAILAPTTYIINDELIQKATVSAFGEITHTFIQRQNENQYSLPFFSYNQPIAITKEAIFSIDHLAVCGLPPSATRYKKAGRIPFFRIRSIASTSIPVIESVLTVRISGEKGLIA